MFGKQQGIMPHFATDRHILRVKTYPNTADLSATADTDQ
jgi:hypothetical protein